MQTIISIQGMGKVGPIQVPLYSTGIAIQYPVANRNGREYFLKRMNYICITESLLCIAETNTTL